MPSEPASSRERARRDEGPQVRVLFLGDVVGRPGREAVAQLLPGLRRRERPDVVVANGENLAKGLGLTEATARELFDAGVDCITSGNHLWHRRECLSYLLREDRVVRPANYPPGTPGASWAAIAIRENLQVAVTNLQGRTFMNAIDCPFRAARPLVEELRRRTPLVLVDFHAEATSEKVAMGWYLDGEVTAVVGTHTHVQTADERILPRGTAYITDVGFTGASDSVLGMRRDIAIQQFLDRLPARHEPAEGGFHLDGVLIQADGRSGRGLGIRRLQVRAEDGEETGAAAPAGAAGVDGGRG